MSAPGLTSEAQLRYLLQWFGEFSELQREDFLPILAAARADKPDILAASLARLSCQDKPVSLFQCRIKLFNEWYPTWSEEEQDRLAKGVTEMDPDFGTKLMEAIFNGPQVNGDTNGTDVVLGSSENGCQEVDEPQSNGEASESVPEEPVDAPVVQGNIPVEIVAAS
ncbi:uncharacterized protein C14orf119 [Hyposmocoma kahamanoa]|uniref:uncharacterized protein C14orf119 n=1 Tax=Hyposmocoma kahamanoa TaxID=1477025 RepID=UPI000E6D85F9|nr:uncharacterized protein C14orf119 [Hyposmocoma kahamanoa]